jgi:hypothetical protein
MSYETAMVMLVVMLAWAAAVLVKAARAVVGEYGYRFGRWDGGTMLEGKTLSRVGTHIKLVVTSFVVFGMIGILARLLPIKSGGVAIAALLGIGLVADAVTGAR